MSAALRGGQAVEIETGGQRWAMSWHPGPEAPTGRRHGSAGICVTATGDVVLISADGIAWDLPAGRPEGDESWEDTLCREVLEEACASVTAARLLGFCRSHCLRGHELGLIIVRAIWLANVKIADWNPQFEISHRRLVPAPDARRHLPAVFQPMWERAFAEAGLC